MASTSASASFITESGDESIRRSVPLLDYLSCVYLPTFHTGKDDFCLTALNKLGRSDPWPRYRELCKLPGTRVLQNVRPIKPSTFVTAAGKYLNEFKDVSITNENGVEQTSSPYLRLPCSSGLVHYDEEDLDFLTSIHNEDDLIRLMKSYPLDTVSESIRMLQRLPDGAPLSDTLKFRRGSKLCSAHHARWDIYVLPTDAFSTIPLAIIFVPPWLFGTEDFSQMTAEQQFPKGALDNFENNNNAPADILWAVIYEVLKGRGYRFVITNYLLWSFGVFREDYAEAQISSPIEAGIMEFDGTTNAPTITEKNVIEMLILWVQMSRGMVKVN